MVNNHEENTILNQLKLFPLYNNQESFFKSPWASIWVNSPNRSPWASNMGAYFRGFPVHLLLPCAQCDVSFIKSNAAQMKYKVPHTVGVY